jgi:hypothetical protein
VVELSFDKYGNLGDEAEVRSWSVPAGCANALLPRPPRDKTVGMLVAEGKGSVTA